MKLTVLGTSSGRPTPRRNVSGLAVSRDGEWSLFDCGEGTQIQLLRTDLRLSRLRNIFITHLHGDHVLGLPGLLGTLNLARHDQPISVYGPPGIGRFLKDVSRAIHFHPIYPLEAIEVSNGCVLETSDYAVIAGRLTHRVPAFGYSLREKPRPGRFDVEAAKSLGLPAGPLYGQLLRGETIEFEGRRIAPESVVGPQRPGARIAYCTDTATGGSAASLAQGADLLVHEATYTADMTDEAEARGHSTAAGAARVALEAGVRQLLITHFSPRYDDVTPLLSEAREIFPNTLAAHDLMELDVSGRA